MKLFCVHKIVLSQVLAFCVINIIAINQILKQAVPVPRVEMERGYKN